VTDAEQLLESANSVLIVDWPSRDVPDALARAGYGVVVKGGPEPDDYAAYELADGEVVARPIGHAPERIDLLYCHRPLEELAGIVAMAQGVAARAVWLQSGLASAGVRDPTGCWLPDDASREARRLVEAAGLLYVDETYICRHRPAARHPQVAPSHCASHARVAGMRLDPSLSGRTAST
jgi:predicted CoA-binding protein